MDKKMFDLKVKALRKFNGEGPTAIYPELNGEWENEVRHQDKFNIYTLDEANEAYANELLNDMLITAKRDLVAAILNVTVEEIDNLFITEDNDDKDSWTREGNIAAQNFILSKMSRDEFAEAYLSKNKNARAEILAWEGHTEHLVEIDGVTFSITKYQ